MGQVLVPGVAQAVTKGTYGPNPWALVWHWRFGGSTADWSTANIQLLADTQFNAMLAHFAPLAAADVIFQSVNTVDIGSVTPAIGLSTATQFPGTRSGATLPLSACMLVSMPIGLRRKGGHPRSYLVLGTQSDATDGHTWSAAFQTLVATGVAAVVNAVVAALPGSGASAAQHCVPVYNYQYVDNPTKHKYQKIRLSLNNVYTIQRYTTVGILATQRRRLQTV